jgi:hypothetical protein
MEMVAAGVSPSMFEYPTREWMALRDLDGPEMNTLNELSRGIANWLDSYRDLGHVFWGGKAVNGQVVVALKACKTDDQREILERLADSCDNAVDRSEDEPGFPGCRGCRAAREDID